MGFEVSEANLVAHGTVTPTNVVNIQLTLNDGDKAYEQIFQFQVPATFSPVHFKLMLTKYLSDPKFTYGQGKECLAGYIAEANARQQQSKDDEEASAIEKAD